MNREPMKEEVKEKDHAKDNASTWLESIRDMLDAADDTSAERESAIEEIQQSALEVLIRSGWYIPGSKDKDYEYLVLLTTGGPALRIRGELNKYMEPENVVMEYQDWGTPWTEYPLEEDDQKTVLRFAGYFWYGE